MILIFIGLVLLSQSLVQHSVGQVAQAGLTFTM